jgi:hypothetical protein
MKISLTVLLKNQAVKTNIKAKTLLAKKSPTM